MSTYRVSRLSGLFLRPGVNWMEVRAADRASFKAERSADRAALEAAIAACEVRWAAERLGLAYA